MYVSGCKGFAVLFADCMCHLYMPFLLYLFQSFVNILPLKSQATGRAF